LTPAQQSAIAAALTLTPSPGNGHNGSVAWSYDVADRDFDFIAAGETLVLTYTAIVDDHHGGVVTTPLTVTVTVIGTNDVPTITATSDGFIELIGTNNATVYHACGIINFTDVDLTDHPTVSSHFTSFSYQNALHADVTSSLTAQQQAAIDAVHPLLSLTPAGTNANDGSAAWSYDLPDNQFDFLTAGEVVTLTYTAVVNDGHGGMVSTPIKIEITGTNDVPDIAVDTSGTAGTNVHDLTEGNAALTTSGSLAVSDADVTNTVAASVVRLGVAGSGNGSRPAGLTDTVLRKSNACGLELKAQWIVPVVWALSIRLPVSTLSRHGWHRCRWRGWCRSAAAFRRSPGSRTPAEPS
jgi:VCBS repeat-containing protein